MQRHLAQGERGGRAASESTDEAHRSDQGRGGAVCRGYPGEGGGDHAGKRDVHAGTEERVQQAEGVLIFLFVL